MSDPFLAEIRIFTGNFAPTGWAFCNGQLLPIAQNTALFSLLGTTYGGDGRSTFALPNLQGSVPVQQGQGPGLSQRILGATAGEPAVTLSSSQMPVHTHTAQAIDGSGTVNSPANAVWAQARAGRVADQIYSSGTTPNLTMSPQAAAPVGGSQPHNNMPPYLGLSFIIALQGIYPQRP